MHCTSDPKPISYIWTIRNSINESPVYQRESAIWPKDKQQLFIDSLLNDYDIPKIYFHDLRGTQSLHQFAVVDGKQRLHTIWEFLTGNLSLAEDFSINNPLGQPYPKPGATFAELSEFWREMFKSKPLPIVLIQDADDEDIEDLFSRLNNGEPLNAAEKRNAMGGVVCQLIRDVATEDFFTKKLKMPNTRYQHLELAAKLLLIEKNQQETGNAFCDLKKRYLDSLVKNNKSMSAAKTTGLKKRVTENLNVLSKVFSNKDPLLAKQAFPPLYYLFIKRLNAEYGHASLHSKAHDFLESFAAMRVANLQKPEDQRDGYISEFARLMQQGTNDLTSLEMRTDILTRYFLQDNLDVTVRDTKRSFTHEERLAIWILGGKKCAECQKALAFDEMEADHHTQWAHGGETTLKNGRSLCGSCNKAASKKVK